MAVIQNITMATLLTPHPNQESGGLDRYEDIVQPGEETRLRIVAAGINYIAIAISMFGMGCVISIKDFSRKEMHLPQSVMIGLLLQYVIQPLVGYLLAAGLGMQIYDALAMIILSTSPVSPFCAVLVYYGDGFVIVGLCLAMFSTALAIGLMPMYFSLYSSTWSEDYYIIATPHEILVYEMLIFVPTAFGVLFKRYAGLKRARIVAKICSSSFIISVVLVAIFNVVDHPDHYTGDWRLWLGGSLLPLIGFLCGFFLAFVLQLPYEACSAVSLAVGTPNWTIATSLAWRFFLNDATALHEVLKLVSIFAIAMPLEGCIWSVMYRAIEEFFQRIYPKCCHGAEEDEDEVKVAGESKLGELKLDDDLDIS
ncbi:ileal sodium/bile acid cotransporter-like [Diadema setosum]|uniref:ileal sodium/bile acid cotransporter-like n=1 Tax=Diadema setosum TaxID=31175 RepID=UPI003B3B723F